MESPIFSIQLDRFRGSDTFVYDSTFQFLFGFSLFFVIYTVAYNVLPILIEKKRWGMGSNDLIPFTKMGNVRSQFHL